MKYRIFTSLALACMATAAQAVVIDGTIGVGEYAGAVVTNVAAQPGLDPTTQYPSNPGSFVENVGYTVFYTSDATNVYVGLQSSAPSGLVFANLYFDTNNATSPGSDIGFEVLNNKAFVPATGVFSVFSLTSLGATYASTAGTGGAGDVIEFSIPWTVFTTNATGLGQPLVAAGGGLQLRTSQSFNYAAVTGDGLAADRAPRFGVQVAPAAAVPEPASWAMMVGGFGLLGGALRRRRAIATTA